MKYVPWKNRIFFFGVSFDAPDSEECYNYTAFKAQLRRYTEHVIKDNASSIIDNIVCYLVNRPHYVHSCCLDYETLRVENHHIVGDWIAGGGLTDSELKKESVNYFLENRPVRFLTSNYFHIVFDANGNLIYDSKDRFKTMTNQEKYVNEDETRYVKDILDAIKTNYEKSDLVLLQDEDDFIV